MLSACVYSWYLESWLCLHKMDFLKMPDTCIYMYLYICSLISWYMCNTWYFSGLKWIYEKLAVYHFCVLIPVNLTTLACYACLKFQLYFLCNSCHVFAEISFLPLDLFAGTVCAMLAFLNFFDYAVVVYKMFVSDMLGHFCFISAMY